MVALTLTFDVEDFVTPESDDATEAVVDLLDRHRLKGSFYVVGEKARTLARRDRRRLISRLARHDVGYHTDLHSVHPTLAELVAPSSWHDGVESIVDRERRGVEDVSEIFGRVPFGFATAGTSWAPQVAPAAAALGLGCHVHSFSTTPARGNPHWFCGTLCFDRRAAVGPFDDALHDDVAAAAALDDLRSRVRKAVDCGTAVVHVFVGHPTTLVTTEFWDKVNFDGTNPLDGTWRSPPLHPAGTTAAALRRLDALLEAISDLPDVECVPTRSVADGIDRSRKPIGEEALRRAQRRAVEVDDPTGALDDLSAAELTYLLARRVAGREDAWHPADVGGPVERPPEFAGGRVPVTVVPTLAQATAEHVERTGHLPASVGAASTDYPISSVLDVLLRSDQGGAVVDVPPRQALPALGAQIARHLEERLGRWLHAPDLETSQLTTHAALQSWTIRPAVTT